MKKVFFSIRKISTLAATLILAMALFSACRKDSNGNSPDLPVAGLMAFNLTPDNSALGIGLSGNLLTETPLGYANYTGNYRNIYPGGRAVESFDYTNDSTIVASDFSFETNKYYSLFVVGNNGVYKNVIINDGLDTLSSVSGQAFVRYINAIPDSIAPTVTITANGSNVVSSPAPFSTVSGFTAVAAGDVNFAVANDDAIAANRTISVEDGSVYTVLLVGVPAAADTAKSVQIKYIQNGVLTEEGE